MRSIGGDCGGLHLDEDLRLSGWRPDMTVYNALEMSSSKGTLIPGNAQSIGGNWVEVD